MRTAPQLRFWTVWLVLLAIAACALACPAGGWALGVLPAPFLIALDLVALPAPPAELSPLAPPLPEVPAPRRSRPPPAWLS